MKATFSMTSGYDEPFVSNAILSILQQTEKDIDIVIFDNRDDRIIRIKDSRVRIFKTHDTPPVELSMKLVEMDTCDIIITNNDDDLSFKERTSISLDYLKDSDIFFGSYIAIDYHGKPMLYVPTPEEVDIEKHKHDVNKFPFCMAAYNKKKVPPFRKELSILADYAAIIDFYNHGVRISTSAIPVGCMRLWKSWSFGKEKLKMEETKRLRVMYNDGSLRTVEVAN